MTTTISSFSAQYTINDSSGNGRFHWYEFTIANNDYSKKYLWIISAAVPARKYFIEKINISSLATLIVNDDKDFTVNQTITLYYYE